MGDIDGKFHFIRRAILDYLLFDFQSEEYKNKYIDFTWRKLYFGLAWLVYLSIVRAFLKYDFQKCEKYIIPIYICMDVNPYFHFLGLSTHEDIQ